MTRRLDFILIAPLGGIVTLMCLMLAGPQWMNADTSLLPVMSIQRPTLFYWGQNRFLNIVPALASPVRSPDGNLIVQLLVFGGGFVSFLALLGHLTARLVLRSTARLDAWLCFALSLLLFVVIASRYALQVFISEGEPYGLSCLLMGLGLLAFLQPRQPGKMAGFLAFAAMAIGGGLNPSLLILAGATCVGAYIVRSALRRRATITFLLSVAATAIWLIIGRLIPGPAQYGKFQVQHFLSNIDATLTFMRNGLALDGLAIAAGISVMATLYGITARQTVDARKARWPILGFCILFTIGWIALFAQNQWVVMNGWHFRYFYPVFVCIPVVLAAPVAKLLLRFGNGVRLTATVSALIATMAILATPWKPIDTFQVFASVKPFVAEAKARDIHLVAGSYWSVWPSVFLMLRDEPAFGLEELRGIGNRRGVLKEIAEIESSHAHAQALCVDAEPRHCVDQAGFVTGLTWQTTPERCGDRCNIIETATIR